MRRVTAAFSVTSLLVILPVFAALAAEPRSAADDAALQTACQKLAVDLFASSGPREWSAPFQSIDAFQAIPVCKEALRLHPDDARLKLAAAFAYIAGRKNEQAKPLLEQLVAQDNSDAMLALAFISKGPEATELMRKAGEGGNASGMMLYGMAQLFGKGVPKDETEGVRSCAAPPRPARPARCSSSPISITRAITAWATILARQSGWLTQAADRGDPSAKEALANLERNCRRRRSEGVRRGSADVATIDAASVGLRTLALTWRIPTRTCL